MEGKSVCWQPREQIKGDNLVRAELSIKFGKAQEPLQAFEVGGSG